MKKAIYKFTSFVFVVYYIIASGYITNEFSKTGSTNNIPVTKPVVYTNPVTKDFTNCIFNQDYFGMRVWGAWHIINRIPEYRDGLHYNSIQLYGGNNGGSFDEPLNSYKDSLNKFMRSLDNSGLKVFYGRQKIERLCYGQRVVYEAEGENNGFSYRHRIAEPTTDSGRSVVHACISCGEDSHNAGCLCCDIDENIQHSDVFEAGYYGDPGNWYRKPVMRIKQSDYSADDSRPVIAVVAKNFEGHMLDSVIIHVNNFRDENSNYYGQYTDKYIFDKGADSLKFSGNQDDGLNKGRSWYLENCRVDFKIYWFGLVDVWFDKLIVDDVMGNNLFNPVASTRQIFEDKVTEEVEEFYNNNSHTSLYTFFADEILYSNIPCVKRVQELIKRTGGTGASLSCATTNFLNSRGLRNQDVFYNEFFTELNPERFQADTHEFNTDKYGRVPENLRSLENRDAKVPDSWYISVNEYNKWLQDTALGDKNNIPAIKKQGSFIYQVNLAKTKADTFSPGSKFIMQPQLHGFLYDTDLDDKYDFGLREPLNEEIQAQAMIALARGADGLCWFTYQSFRELDTQNSLQETGKTSDSIAARMLYCFGMLTVNPDEINPTARTLNQFGQNKWDYVSQMNDKLSKWKPTLDQIEWQSGWSIHSEGAGHELIDDIQSIDPHKSGFNTACYPDSLVWQDCPNERFWEMGFFTKTGFPNEKYFMMVNRRCIPFTPNSIPVYYGDDRVLKIKFDEGQLSESVKWMISEVGNIMGETKIFSRDGGYIDLGASSGYLGWFEPGEGKLFKLVPVY